MRHTLFWGLVVILASAVPEAVSLAQGAADEPSAQGVKAPTVIFPRTISQPDDDPRPPVLRLLSRGRFTLNVHDADLPGLLLGLGKDIPATSSWAQVSRDRSAPTS